MIRRARLFYLLPVKLQYYYILLHILSCLIYCVIIFVELQFERKEIVDGVPSVNFLT